MSKLLEKIILLFVVALLGSGCASGMGTQFSDSGKKVYELTPKFDRVDDRREGAEYNFPCYPDRTPSDGMYWLQYGIVRLVVSNSTLEWHYAGQIWTGEVKEDGSFAVKTHPGKSIWARGKIEGDTVSGTNWQKRKGYTCYYTFTGKRVG